jgi:hypothetical protein
MQPQHGLVALESPEMAFLQTTLVEADRRSFCPTDLTSECHMAGNRQELCWETSMIVAYRTLRPIRGHKRSHEDFRNFTALSRHILAIELFIHASPDLEIARRISSF